MSSFDSSTAGSGCLLVSVWRRREACLPRTGGQANFHHGGSGHYMLWSRLLYILVTPQNAGRWRHCCNRRQSAFDATDGGRYDDDRVATPQPAAAKGFACTC
jgi:hypothetical protein